MFALCKFNNEELRFILYDEKDFTDTAKQMNIEIEESMDFAKFAKDFALYPLMAPNDLIIHSLNHKFRTATDRLDEVGISCWAKLKQEYAKVQEKKSNLSRSQRELVEKQYTLINTL